MNRRTAANRRNALRSTGPKSAEGKRAARYNGLRHGLLSRDIVLPGEDAGGFEALRTSVHDDLAPVGSLERFLADRIASAAWRLRRVERTETTTFAWRIVSLEAGRLGGDVREQEFTLDLALDPPFIRDEAAHGLAARKLEQARRTRDGDPLLIGRAFDADANEGDAFGKLARYETSIERSLYRALHELERLQARRKGLPVSPPQVLDVSVSREDRK
jgi:hypothetical protein